MYTKTRTNSCIFHTSAISACIQTSLFVQMEAGRCVLRSVCLLECTMLLLNVEARVWTPNPHGGQCDSTGPKEPTHQLLDQPQVPPTREVQGTVQGSLVTTLRMSLFCKIIVCVFSKKCFVGDGLSRPPLIDKFSINFLPKGPACPVCSWKLREATLREGTSVTQSNPQCVLSQIPPPIYTHILMKCDLRN